jgi:hypothetical protein
MLSSLSSRQMAPEESMDPVILKILKKKENKKKWNDAYRKRLKEKSNSPTIKRSLILEKQRQKEYYNKNRNILRETKRKIRESNKEVESLRHKSYYQ